MLDMIRARLRQGTRTTRFPRGAPPTLPERFRGLPSLRAEGCGGNCSRCIEACPTGAVSRPAGAGPVIDLGLCTFCGDCARACPAGAISFTQDYRLATRTRDGLRMGQEGLARADALAAGLRRVLGRSLRLRQVSAGGCNACEADANVLTTVGWDLGRFGISFVASPRHADGLLVTGPVTRAMRLALEKTWDAVPEPKIVVACGACALSGGPYAGSPACCGGAAEVVPVDLFVPGCPPHPLTLLDGLLRLLGRIR
jgi:Ni,Fe-hydrogenase III small subunit/NAD-dependent dihydropyrimidine dehydrogenase PreA subunit